LNDRLDLCKEVIKVMDILADRDTLTQWYNYLHNDSAKAVKARARDPHYNQRVAFITSYLASAPPSRQAEKFPLSDRRITFGNLVVEFTAYKMMFKIMDFNDLKPKGEFSEVDRKMRSLLNLDSGFAGLGNLAEDMREDTVFQQEMNDKILELQNGLGDIQQLLSYFTAPGDTADTAGGVEQQSKGNIDSVITSLGGSLVFYQFGDHLDNDADGCIDEELVDSSDNDLDGFVDEDARLIGGTPGSIGDGVNNDRQFTTDDNFENTVNKEADLLTFVAPYGQNWVLIKKDGPLIDIRIRIQSDSLAVRLTPGARPIPAQYQVKLDSAKNSIGGCWRYY
jgi:hypothetical protein